jgi:hypothetical protein
LAHCLDGGVKSSNAGNTANTAISNISSSGMMRIRCRIDAIGTVAPSLELLGVLTIGPVFRRL